MKQRGFILNLVLIIIGILILNYFGFSIREFLNSPEVHDRFIQIWTILKMVWHDYLVTPFWYVWNKIVIGIFWETIKNLLDKVKVG